MRTVAFAACAAGADFANRGRAGGTADVAFRVLVGWARFAAALLAIVRAAAVPPARVGAETLLVVLAVFAVFVVVLVFAVFATVLGRVWRFDVRVAFRVAAAGDTDLRPVALPPAVFRADAPRATGRRTRVLALAALAAARLAAVRFAVRFAPFAAVPLRPAVRRAAVELFLLAIT